MFNSWLLFEAASQVKDFPSCEACRISPATNLIPDSNLHGSTDCRKFSYSVCYPCGQRLIRNSLRPIEWFNLAAIHGSERGLLCSGHYDKAGRADICAVGEVSTDGMLAPSLSQAARAIDTLFDYCVTRQQEMGPAEYNAFRAFEHSEILAHIEDRLVFDRTEISITCFNLCAYVLGSAAREILRVQDQETLCRDVFDAWARAVACCLPESEGFELASEVVTDRLTRHSQYRMTSLMWFQSHLAIDWINAHAPEKNISDDWGLVASVSKLSWKDVENWLGHGRPFNLIALDALKFCVDPHHMGIFDILWPTLHDRPDDETIQKAMQTTASRDDVPRITSGCEFIARNLRWV